jgi:outer membrane lipoprotein LolB
MIRALPITLAAAMLLAACAHLPVEGDGFTLAERRAQLDKLAGWDMRGRLAVSTAEDGFSGSFQWRKRDDHVELLIRGPFGAGVLQVSGTRDALTVRARGDTWLLGDPEPELSALLGWWMPVASLDAWLVGMPDAVFPARSEPGTGGTLSAFEQRLWRLEFPLYQLAQGILLPRRIDMSHGDIALRLTVDSFQAAVPAGSLN